MTDITYNIWFDSCNSQYHKTRKNRSIYLAIRTPDAENIILKDNIITENCQECGIITDNKSI